MSNFEIMGPEYGKAGYKWAMGDDEITRLYESQHSFDPTTGDLLGPLGPVPHYLAIKYQSIHNQLVWRARNRMAQDAVRMMQGAAGTLGSFRAGGGAQLESGVFGQAAGLQMQRANMMQPMDLMADWRRDQDHRARSAGGGNKWASIGGGVLSAVGSGVSLAGYPYIGIPLSAAGAALQGYGAGSGQGYYPQQGGYGAGGGMFGGGQPGQPNGGQPMQGSPAMGQPGSGPYGGALNPPPSPGGPAPAGGGPLGGALNPPAGGTGQARLGQPSGGPTGGVGAPQGGDGAKAGAPGQPGGGQGAAGAAGGMAYVPTGAGDGGMLPVQRVARRLGMTPYPREFDTVMSEVLVQELESDPSYALLTASIDQEVMLRFSAGRVA